MPAAELMLVRATRHGTEVSSTAAELENARALFARHHYFRLTDLLDPELLEWIQARIAASAFYDFSHGEHGEIAGEHRLRDDVLTPLLEFVVNCPRLWNVIESVTGCPAIGSFRGRVFRRTSQAGHFDSWHNDVKEDRMMAMSLNLSLTPFEGGTLAIRDVSSQRVLAEIENPRAGDAVVFRISPDLEHRVARVTGTAARIAYSGWFYSVEDASLWGTIRTFDRRGASRSPETCESAERRLALETEAGSSSSSGSERRR
jgi:hypothetical protein